MTHEHEHENKSPLAKAMEDFERRMAAKGTPITKIEPSDTQTMTAIFHNPSRAKAVVAQTQSQKIATPTALPPSPLSSEFLTPALQDIQRMNRGEEVDVKPEVRQAMMDMATKLALRGITIEQAMQMPTDEVFRIAFGHEPSQEEG